MKQAVCIALALCLLLGLTGCGSAAGRYNLTSITTEEDTVLVSDIPNAPPMYLHLNDDGTGILLLSDEAVRMYWDGSFLWPEGQAQDKVPYVLEGKTLTMEQNGQKMVFTKEK